MAHEMTPHQFLGGTETEFAVMPIFHDGRLANDVECGEMAYQTINNMPPDLHVSRERGYEKSGRRIYKDVGGVLEVATAEFRSYRELVHATIAGEYLAVSGAINAVKDRPDLDSVAIFGRVIDDQDTTWGHHENYLIRRDTFSEGISGTQDTSYNTLRRAMCAHLATRVIFTGAGILRPVHDNPARVVPGQKTRSLHKDISSTTTREKPLFNIRDEPHAEGDKWARLHVVSGDYNISPFASWLRFGTTAIVAYLCEIGMLHADSPMYLPEKKAASTARRIGNTPNVTFRTANGGRKVKAVDIEDQFCEVAETCADRYPGLLSPEDLEITATWRDTIDTFRRDPAALTPKIDYMARAKFLQDYSDRRPASARKLREVEKYWDNLIMGKAVERREEAGMPGYDEKEITHLLRQPPLDTRANIRGKILDLAAHTPDVDAVGSWNILKLSRSNKDTTLKLPVESNGIPDDITLAQLHDYFGDAISEEYFKQQPDCRKQIA